MTILRGKSLAAPRVKTLLARRFKIGKKEATKKLAKGRNKRMQQKIGKRQKQKEATKKLAKGRNKRNYPKAIAENCQPRIRYVTTERIVRMRPTRDS